ncbi:MAG: cache domain-containing protein, partial [Campylobacterota bacterium]
LLNSTQTNAQQINRLENVHNLTQTLLNQQMQYALSMSMLLADDGNLKEAYIQKDREKTYRILTQKLLKQNISYDVQIHDKQLKTFLRSWDKDAVGEALSSFRVGLVEVKKTQEPQVSLELGKRLNIKAISPIFDKGAYIGSVEVIVGFASLQQMLQDQGTNLYILLHQKYLDIARDTRNNPQVGNYIVANFDAKQTHLNALENSNLNDLDIYGYIIKENIAFSYFAIYDSSGTELGYIITTIEV